MDISQINKVDEIVKASLAQGITYEQYREKVKDLVAQQSTSGLEQSEDRVNFTVLNDRRMKRWDKTIKVPQDIQEAVSKFQTKVTWLVITESWCGDAAHVVPAINKVAELNDNITLKLVFRDEHEALMDEFLTNGGRSIPKLIMVEDATGEVINTFGPRPTKATEMVEAYKAEHGALTPEFKEELQVWYNTDKGQSVISDLVRLLL
ncbi:thioredoxin family protein [Mangrovimonas sp. YM274]|uniref:thioredoxin family protein n=1 Tax=Mangrovimonas sp. YM274 TaxID=3070660 RepID=UPI0027DD9AA5|nr:thioredoxin family protein [Mangrovimonas sp. YM274]WMI69303.1 thioredoxin family protein [Mangrovimonas sp. YM274]